MLPHTQSLETNFVREGQKSINPGDKQAFGSKQPGNFGIEDKIFQSEEGLKMFANINSHLSN